MNNEDLLDIFDDWDIEEVPQQFFKKWRKKIKRSVKKVAHKVNRGVTKAKAKVIIGVKKDIKAVVKVTKKIGKFVVKMSLAAAFLPLLPFKKSMEHLLRQRGIKVKRKGFGFMTIRFVKLLLTNHLEGDKTTANLTKLLSSGQLAALSAGAASTPATEGIPIGIIATLVPILVGLFKKLKAKQLSGAKLTPTETKMLDLADKSTDALKDATISQIDQKSGEIMRKKIVKFGKFVKDNKLVIGGSIIALGVAVAGYKRLNKKTK